MATADKPDADERRRDVSDTKAADNIGLLLRQGQTDTQRPNKPTGEADLNQKVVSHVERDRDDAVKLLVTTDGRTFERSNGQYLVTVPGMDKKVAVNDLTVSNGTISYRIGNLVATEGNGGQRTVTNLEDIDRARKSNGALSPDAPSAQGAIEGVAERARNARVLTAQDRQLILGTIKAHDELASDPQKRDERIRKLEELVGGSGDDARKTEWQRQIQELKDPAGTAARLRLQAAEIIARTPEKDAARKLLSEALDKDPNIASDVKFATALVRAEVQNDRALLQKFAKYSGNPSLLRMFADHDLYVPSGSTLDQIKQINQPQTSFNQPAFADPTLRKSAEKYLNADPSTKEGEAARKEAMKELETQRDQNNPYAQRALDGLALLELLQGAQQGLQRESGIMPSPRFSAADRLAKYAELTQDTAAHRNAHQVHHTINGILVDHFVGAQNQNGRDQALDILRKEVQDGNNSALHVLQMATTMDSALKIGDAQKTLADPQSTVDQRMEADRKMRDALRDLALQAESANGKLANDYLDMLRKHPTSGIQPEYIDGLRQQAKERLKNMDAHAGEAAKKAISGTPEERERAAQDLERLERDQILTRGKTNYSEALQRINVNSAATDVMNSLTRPDDVAQKLITFGLLAQRNYTAKSGLDVLESNSGPKHQELLKGVIPTPDTKALGPEAKKAKENQVDAQRKQLEQQLNELNQAIKSGDKAVVADLMRSPNVVAAVATIMEPHAEQNRQFSKLKTSELMQVFNNPEKLLLAEEDARKYAKESLEKAESAIGKYLSRDKLSEKVRDALLPALPADGAFKLTSEQAPLKETLQAAVDKHHLTPPVEALVKTLLKNGELSKESVAELKKELEQTGEARRIESLADFKRISADRLGRIGGDFESMVHDLESVEQSRKTSEAATKALKVLESTSSSQKDKDEALASLREEFKKFHGLATDGFVHQLAHQHFDQLLNGLIDPDKPELAKGAFEQLTRDLASNNPEDVLRAAKTIAEKLPNGADEADEFRALRTVRTLGPESKSEDFQRASAQLADEIEAGRSETGKPSRHALVWKTWSDVQKDVTGLGEAATAKDSGAAKTAMDSLAKQAREGKGENPYATSGLSAALVGMSDKEHMGEWLTKFPAIVKKPIYLPKLDELPNDQKLDLMHRAADALGDSVVRDKLTERDAAAIAVAYVKAGELGDKALQDKFGKILHGAIDGPNRDQIVDGLHFALNGSSKGSEGLADIYLKGAESPRFAAHFADMEALARQGSKAGLTIMAGVAAGMADNNKEFNQNNNAPALRSRRLLEDLGALPENHKSVVDALMHVHDLSKVDVRFKDRNQLYSTLGTIAGNGVTDRPDVRDALRAGFVASNNELDSPAHKSALDGMAKMAKFWTKEDVATFTAKLTPDVIGRLSAVADQMPSDLRSTMLKDFAKVVEGDKTVVPLADRTAAVKAMAAAGKYLDIAQVNMLASFGGDARYNLPGINGAQRLEQLGITGDAQKQFKADVADTLMSVMARSQNAKPPATDGPRERAFQAFRDVPWPINSVDANGKPTVEASNLSNKLRDNLVKYFQGRPYDVGLAGQIGRIVDHAHLPLPPAELLRNAGIPLPGREKRPGDRDNVFDVADKIIERYSKDGKDGVEVLRQALKNVDQVNALSGAQRAVVMGWDKRSETEKKELGWSESPDQQTLRKLGLQALGDAERNRILGDGKTKPSDADLARLESLGARAWAGMGENQKNELRWEKAEKVSAKLVTQLMSNGRLEQTPNALIVGDLTKELTNVKEQEMKRVQALDRDIASLQSSRKSNASELARMTTKDAPCLVERAFWTFTLPNNGVDPFFEKRQNELARSFAKIQVQVNQLEAQRGQANYRYNQYATAIDAGEHKDLRNRGEQVSADALALKMWEQHKGYLSVAAPDVWASLTINSDNSLQGASSLKRLKDRGLVQWDIIPGYESGRSADGRTFDARKNFEGFEQALGLRPAANADDKRGLVQLSADEKLKDVAGMRANMFGRMNEDPVLHKFSATARGMNEHLGELSKMFQAGNEGIKYDGFVEVAKQKSAIVKNALESVSQDDVKELRVRIETMDKALAEMKNGGGNAKAIKELEEQIKTYKGMHDLFNREPLSNYLTENLGIVNDKDGKAVYDDNGAIKHKNPREDVLSMCNTVLDGAFTASTASNWVKQNGVLIGATLLATAATVAACATLGISSPLAVGAWVAVAGLVAKEATNEVLYHVNKGGYTGFGQYKQHGADLGHWARHDSGKSDADEKLFAVLAHHGIDITVDMAAFLATAGLSKFVLSAGSQGIRKSAGEAVAFWRATPNPVNLAYQSERMAAQGVLPKTQSFVREFRENFAREMRVNMGFSAVHQTSEAQIHELLTPERMAAMGENGQFLMGWGLSTSLAIGQGLMHGHMGANNTFKFEMKEGHTFEQMKTHFEKKGFVLTQLEPGKYSCIEVGAPPSVKPVIMEDVAARGHSLPPEHVFGTPEGQAVRPGESRPRELGAVDLGEGRKFEPTEQARAAHEHNAAITKAFMEGRFEDAYREAVNPAKTPAKTTIVERLVEFDAVEMKNASPERRIELMRQFMSAMGDAAKVSQGDNGSVTAVVAKPVADVGGVKVDMLTGKALTHDPLTGDPFTHSAESVAKAEKAVSEFTSSEQGKAFVNRVMAEKVLIAQEELIHAHQLANGGKPLSASYAEFVKSLENPTAEHTASFTPEGAAQRTKMTLEQEAILALHDSDPKNWTVERLREHFGSQYPEMREPAFKFLEERARQGVADFKTTLPENNFRGLTAEQSQELKSLVEQESQNKKGSPEEQAARLKQLQGIAESLKDAETINFLAKKFEMEGNQFVDKMLSAAREGDYFRAELLANAEKKINSDPKVIEARRELAEARERTWTPVDKLLSSAHEALRNPETGLSEATKRMGPVREFNNKQFNNINKNRMTPEAAEQALRAFAKTNPNLATDLLRNASVLSSAEKGLKEIATPGDKKQIAGEVFGEKGVSTERVTQLAKAAEEFMKAANDPATKLADLKDKFKQLSIKVSETTNEIEVAGQHLDANAKRETRTAEVKEAAMKLSKTKEAAFKSALDEALFPDGSFKPYINSDSIKAKGEWIPPKQPNGERQAPIKLPADCSEGQPITQRLIIESVSNEGVHTRIEIPEGAVPRMANDEHGIVFRIPEDLAKGKPNQYIRVTEPKAIPDGTAGGGAKYGIDYKNGYVRVTQDVLVEKPNSSGGSEWTPLKVARKSVEVNMIIGANGKPEPVLGIGTPAARTGGRPAEAEWIVLGDTVTSVAALKAQMLGTKLPILPDAQKAIQEQHRLRLQNYVDRETATGGFWQNKTHMHVAPDALIR